ATCECAGYAAETRVGGRFLGRRVVRRDGRGHQDRGLVWSAAVDSFTTWALFPNPETDQCPACNRLARPRLQPRAGWSEISASQSTTRGSTPAMAASKDPASAILEPSRPVHPRRSNARQVKPQG